ncbi:DUF4192 domain-containing protein [Blastococcus sp. VKM Ac-2987]|uniref:DUF4192 domain-containing protein n=1 Tax=Blastococcus sp. VKM Ac-2987 TaxID=3004141 RepID=UPI0022AB6162|nr:DUF4192 domain-containing protein [Blastococcus sp. VKM Ac-2987]MCZ2860131.1 DUF4192 domain-containing protein [Blastococcus sp. VKM Ac-2987]
MDATAEQDRSDDRPEVRISDPGEVAAALPHLLGFHPRESVVLIGLGGPSGGRVGLTVRADLPPAGAGAAAARLLARSLRTDDPVAALVVVVSEAADDRAGPGAGYPGAELPHRALVHDLVLALAAVDVPVRDVLLVRRGRWWSYDCPHPCCAPAVGTPLPAGVSALAAASVTTGQVVAADRSALGARLTAPPGAPDGVRRALERLAVERAARLLEGGRTPDAEPDAVVRQAVARSRPGAPDPGDPLDDDELARLLEVLQDVGVRDRALQLALGADAVAAELLWTECTRRAPAPLDAAPATLLAVSAWLRGDGALANVALDRALAGDPGYALARLLSQGLAACLPPGELRALIARAPSGAPGVRPA